MRKVNWISKLSLLLVSAALLLLLPSVALAAMDSWPYTVEVSIDGNAEEVTGSGKSFDLGTAVYGTSAVRSKTVQVTFNNLESNTKNLSMFMVESSYFTGSWAVGTGEIAPGASDTFIITPVENIPAGPEANGYRHEISISFMDQNSRRGVTIILCITVEPKEVSVTLIDVPEKEYGQTMAEADISYTLTGLEGDGHDTLKSLGVTLVSNGFSAGAPAGDYPIQLDAGHADTNYAVTLEDADDARVTVRKATPELVYVNASGVYSGGRLSSSTLEGQYRNPYTLEKVDGTFTWENGGEVLTEDTEQSSSVLRKYYSFTPADTDNYERVEHAPAEVIVSDLSPTDITAQPGSLNVTYDGKPHGVEFTKTEGNRNDLKIRYALSGTDDWTEVVPTNAGVYDVRATIPADEAYAAGSVSAVLTIAQRPIVINLIKDYLIYSRPYTGSTEATDCINWDYVQLRPGSILPGDNITVNYKDSISAEFDKPDVGDRTVTVTLDADRVMVSGDAARNYCVAGQSVTVKTTIFPRPVYLELREILTKEYGQSITLLDTDYRIDESREGGLVGFDGLKQVRVRLGSKGIDADAAVGTYGIDVLSNEGNYVVKAVSGTVEVTKTTPREVGITVGVGYVGNAIGTVAPPKGSFINPHTGQAVPGTIIWTDPNARLPEKVNGKAEFGWKFIPNDTKNYKEITGTIEVTASAKRPVDIELIIPSRLTYNGKGQGATATADIPGKVSFVFQYRRSGESKWSGTLPVNAGTYEVKVTATPTDPQYSENTVTGTMTIAPTALSGTATASKIKEGAMLSTSVLTPDFRGVDGRTVSGTITWNNANGAAPEKIPAEKNTDYSWTFIPDDPNYTPAAGSAKVVDSTLATPKLSSVVADSATSITVKWGAVSGASKYRVFYKTGTGNWTVLADVNTTSYTWTGAKAGTAYTFTVRCLAADGSYNSAYDTVGKSVTTPAAGTLATPVLSSVKADSATSITVTWGAVSGASKYRVFYKTGTGNWTVLADTASTSYTWTGAKTGTAYTFTVRCLSVDGKSYISNFDTVGKSITPLTMPQLSSVKADSATSITVTWGAVSGASKYRVFYKTGTGSWIVLADTASTSYTWTGAKTDTAYTFTVRCLSADGSYNSAYDTVGKSITPLTTPQLSSVKADSATSITVTWGAVSGASKYRVFYKTGTGSWTVLADTNTASYTWTGAKAGTKYTFTVRCLSANGSYASGFDSVGKSITPLTTPQLKSVSATSSGITVTWGAVSGASQYRVFYKTGTGNWTVLADTASASYTWTGAKAGTKYTFTVRCLAADGSYASGFDTVGKSITPLAAPKLSSVSANSAASICK